MKSNNELNQVETSDYETISEQEARAFLRERYLRLLTHLQGKNCEVKTYGGNTVSCKVRSFEPTMEHIVVDDLKTPIPPVLDKAVLRCQDIRSLSFTLSTEEFMKNPLMQCNIK